MQLCHVMHGLINMKMTCFHLLKIASDGNFNFFGGKKLLAFRKLNLITERTILAYDTTEISRDKL